MVAGTDNTRTSIAAVYHLWKSKSKPITFPKIPGSMEVAELGTWINNWLFKTGYLSSHDYWVLYNEIVVPESFDSTKALDEIFSAESGAKGE